MASKGLDIAPSNIARELEPEADCASRQGGVAIGWGKALCNMETLSKEPSRVKIGAIIVAAGRGERARAAGRGPKQYAAIAGEAVLRRALRAFLGHPRIGAVLPVIHGDDGARYQAATLGLSGPLLAPVLGGPTRQASVLAGLERLAEEAPDWVLIHDAARPFVSSAVLARVLAALERCAGAVPALPLSDTLKRCGPDGGILETVDRSVLWRAQTPQGFHFAPILAAHRSAHAKGRTNFTDDAAIAEWAGLRVTCVAGEEANRKLTTAEDIIMANRETMAPPSLADIRTGQGFDVHRFTAGDHVWLCGVKVPHTQSLEGHSDADVALHALTDALLGAIGDGDIGQHFPPSDPQWKGAASHMFLADAARRVRALGGTIANADITILCEAPKISPHREAMRQRIAQILGIEVSRIGVKATTTEQLGFTGRREGIAAMAIATVRLPTQTAAAS